MELYKVANTCVEVRFVVKGFLENNVYFISDDTATIVVDPSCDADDLIQILGGANLDAIVLTHRHADHVGAAAELREKTGATVFASSFDTPFIERGESGGSSLPAPPPCQVDHPVVDGEVVTIGNMAWKVYITPGHTAGSMCWFLQPEFGSNKEGAPVLISGDTLFAGTVGRTDFVSGSPEDMRKSITRLAVLPDETIVLPGHNDLTTIGAERNYVFAQWAN